MTLNEYQDKAMSTCMVTCDNIGYMLLNLVAEVGEFSGKLAKAIRKDKIAPVGHFDMAFYQRQSVEEGRELEIELQKELGDILWQAAGVAASLGWGLEDIAEMNIAKLASRKERGVIDGSGDNR